jgi:hypothetical protein
MGDRGVSSDSNANSDAAIRKTDDSAPSPASQLPRWIPQWMGEQERAACVLTIGLIVGAAIIAAAILIAFDKILVPES